MSNETEGNDTIEEQSKRLLRVAIKDARHLKRWLEETDRRWLVINTHDLVDSLPFPEGISTFMQVIACYRDHRQTIPSGRTERQESPTGEDMEVTVMKTDNLEKEEIDRAIRYLVGRITNIDPNWSLESPPA